MNLIRFSFGEKKKRLKTFAVEKFLLDLEGQARSCLQLLAVEVGVWGLAFHDSFLYRALTANGLIPNSLGFLMMEKLGRVWGPPPLLGQFVGKRENSSVGVWRKMGSEKV